MEREIKVVGGGLAGCELALQLAHLGVRVALYEMKPHQRTPAQDTDLLSELVCSNSFRSANTGNAIGQLKREMRSAGSFIMEAQTRRRCQRVMRWPLIGSSLPSW